MCKLGTLLVSVLLAVLLCTSSAEIRCYEDEGIELPCLKLKMLRCKEHEIPPNCPVCCKELAGMSSWVPAPNSTPAPQPALASHRVASATTNGPASLSGGQTFPQPLVISPSPYTRNPTPHHHVPSSQPPSGSYSSPSSTVGGVLGGGGSVGGGGSHAPFPGVWVPVTRNPTPHHYVPSSLPSSGSYSSPSSTVGGVGGVGGGGSHASASSGGIRWVPALPTNFHSSAASASAASSSAASTSAATFSKAATPLKSYGPIALGVHRHKVAFLDSGDDSIRTQQYLANPHVVHIPFDSHWKRADNYNIVVIGHHGSKTCGGVGLPFTCDEYIPDPTDLKIVRKNVAEEAIGQAGNPHAKVLANVKDVATGDIMERELSARLFVPAPRTDFPHRVKWNWAELFASLPDVKLIVLSVCNGSVNKDKYVPISVPFPKVSQIPDGDQYVAHMPSGGTCYRVNVLDCVVGVGAAFDDALNCLRSRNFLVRHADEFSPEYYSPIDEVEAPYGF